jgi:hydrogenase nickel incorporation protein HypA/HybF
VHEFGLAEGVLATVLERAAGRPVTGVVVRAGVRHRLVEESMQHAFSVVAAGGVAAAAQVHLEPVPVDLACAACGYRGTSDDPFAVCPGCGSVDVDVSGGDELTLVSLRLAPAPDGAPGRPTSAGRA